MTLTLTATAGSASANTFITLADANSYHEARVNNSDWTGATDANKNAALVWATRLLDDQPWYGQITATTQALRWPRTGCYDREGNALASTTIPAFLENATAELAMFLLAEDRTAGAGALSYETLSVGPVTLSRAKHQKFPPAVLDLIAYYFKASMSSFQVGVVRA